MSAEVVGLDGNPVQSEDPMPTYTVLYRDPNLPPIETSGYFGTNGPSYMIGDGDQVIWAAPVEVVLSVLRHTPPAPAANADGETLN